MTLSAPSGNKIVHMQGDTIITDSRCPVALHKVLNNLHASNHYEFSALEVTRDDVHRLIHHAHEAYLVRYKGDAVFVWGVIYKNRWTRTLYGFGTPNLVRALPAVCKWVQTRWLDRQFEEGVKRIETRVPEHAASISWLKKLGMREECVMHHVGVTDDLFVQLSYTLSDHVH